MPIPISLIILFSYIPLVNGFSVDTVGEHGNWVLADNNDKRHPKRISRLAAVDLGAQRAGENDNNNNDDGRFLAPKRDSQSSHGGEHNNIEHNQLGAWVPVGSASSLSPLTPFRVEIMGRNFVVWDSKPSSRSSSLSPSHQDISERWSVLLDSCPHRLAPLSLGRIDPDTNCLECPYHGWQFATNGTLTRLPQLDDGEKSLGSIVEKGSATSFPVHLTGDLVWTFLPTSMHGESFPQSLLPEDYFPGVKDDIKRGGLFSAHELPASMDITVENGMDPSHFPFAHHGVISKRSDAGPMPMKTLTSNFTHLDISASYNRNGEPRERLYSFQRPFLLCTQEKTGESSWKQASKFFVVPVHEGRCRIITSVEKLSKKWFPSWLVHVLVSRLFAGDYFLHDTEIERQGSGRYYFQPTSADESSRAWNRWHSKNGMANSPPHTFRSASPLNLTPLPRRVHEDQWLLHTYSCSTCRTALRRGKIAKVAAAGVSGFALASIIFKKNYCHPLLAVAVSSTGFLVSWAASRVVSFHEGNVRPSDATDRSSSMYKK